MPLLTCAAEVPTKRLDRISRVYQTLKKRGVKKENCEKRVVAKAPLRRILIDHEFRKLFASSPSRPPDWPWARVKYLLYRGFEPFWKFDDERIERCLAFARELQRSCKDCDLQYDLSIKEPHLCVAHEVYSSLATIRRTVLESWLLTGASSDVISEKTNLPIEVVECYEACFFNVRDCLSASGYISTCILKLFPQPAPTLDNVLKSFAYRAGPYVLQRVIELLVLPAKLPIGHGDPRMAMALSNEERWLQLDIALFLLPTTAENATKVNRLQQLLQSDRATVEPSFFKENLPEALRLLEEAGLRGSEESRELVDKLKPTA